MTNTTSQYYCAHAGLPFPADIPRMNSTGLFLHWGSFQQPLSSAISCTPIPNCSSWDNQNPCQRKLAISFFFLFSSFVFSGWTLGLLGEVQWEGLRWAARQGGKFCWCQDRTWWGGGGEQGSAGHISPWTLDGRSSKALDSKWIQLFTFVILQ